MRRPQLSYWTSWGGVQSLLASRKAIKIGSQRPAVLWCLMHHAQSP